QADRLRSSPDFAEEACEVAAEDLGHAALGVAAGEQQARDGLQLAGAVEVWQEGVDVLLLTRSGDAKAAAVGDVLAMALHELRRQLDARYHAVGADPHVILAADVHGVLDVSDEIRGRGLAVAAEERHQVDPDHPASLG